MEFLFDICWSESVAQISWLWMLCYVHMAYVHMVVGNPLPKMAEGCAAAPRQFGRATAKKVANPCRTFHKSDFFKILMAT